MYRVAVVEDVEFDRSLTTGYIAQYGEEKEQSFEILEYGDGEDLVRDYPENLDILFLDIGMEKMDGLRTARLVRKKDRKVILFFLTGMAQYAVQGYSVEAMDFIVKPVSYTGFKVRMDRALAALKKNEQRKISLRAKEGVIAVDISGITYLETGSHKVLVHLTDRVLEVSATMRGLEKELTGLPFFRCHNSFLVNLNYVDRIHGNDVWVNGQLLSISRYRRAEFLDAWAAYLGG